VTKSQWMLHCRPPKFELDGRAPSIACAVRKDRNWQRHQTQDRQETGRRCSPKSHLRDFNLSQLRKSAAGEEGVGTSASAREESRGAHYRTDCPGHDDKKFLKHSEVKGEAARSMTMSLDDYSRSSNTTPSPQHNAVP